MAHPPHSHEHNHAGHDHKHDRHGHSHHGNDHYDHHHHHHDLGGELGTVFAISIALNVGFVVIEGVFGFISHSMALLADAGHNFGDVLGLVAAWAATMLAARRPSARYTYGLRSSSILAALLNAIILLIAVGGIVVEAAQRLVAPTPVGGVTIIAVACAGVLVNGAAALMLGRGHHSDLNVRSAYAHMLGDALVSVGVALSGAVILWTGWLWLDPAVSIVVSIVIVIGTWRLLRHSLDMALQAVPPGIDPAAVRMHLLQVSGVGEVHDLHIWPMSTTTTALTAHLIMPAGHPGDACLADVAASLQKRFGIEHATIQVETGDPAHPCVLVPDNVV
ncbi:MAG TPA: cation diffusion facilitator family transporter [Stellaceae bacterium]|nr:cation diffusion facilitator family transporter [Stellaceae bacterium]